MVFARGIWRLGTGGLFVVWPKRAGEDTLSAYMLVQMGAVDGRCKKLGGKGESV